MMMIRGEVVERLGAPFVAFTSLVAVVGAPRDVEDLDLDSHVILVDK